MMKLIGIEEHFVTADLRAAWAASPIGQEGTTGFDRGEIEARLDDLGEQRLALMDESGVDVQMLSVTTPSLHNLEPEESVVLAQRTNDLKPTVVADNPFLRLWSSLAFSLVQGARGSLVVRWMHRRHRRPVGSRR